MSLNAFLDLRQEEEREHRELLRDNEALQKKLAEVTYYSSPILLTKNN